jgi:GGDEF domain-containing protein
MTMNRTLTLLLVQSKHPLGDKNPKQREAVWGEAAKAMSGKLRPTDSIYNLSRELFAIVLPETDTLNAKRVAVRLQEQLQAVRAKYDLSLDISVHNFPEHVQSSHELEDIVKSLLPEKRKWELPVEPQPA